MDIKNCKKLDRIAMWIEGYEKRGKISYE